MGGIVDEILAELSRGTGATGSRVGTIGFGKTEEDTIDNIPAERLCGIGASGAPSAPWPSVRWRTIPSTRSQRSSLAASAPVAL
eukprot:8649462-Alexandrium_andersonii.AAC.1